MDMDGVADNGPATQETTPGGFIPLNGWAQLTVRPVQPTSLSREVSLSVINDGNGRIEVWNAGKTQQMTAPFSPTTDTTCWVTGTQVSSSLRDVTLCLTHTQTGFKDKIKLTVWQLKHETISPVPENRDRTLLGIGEHVRCWLEPPFTASWTSTTGTVYPRDGTSETTFTAWLLDS
jgi:hypothetical protein